MVLWCKRRTCAAHNGKFQVQILAEPPIIYVPVAELVDAVDLKSTIPEKNVEVQVLLGTPNKFIKILLDILVKI